MRRKIGIGALCIFFSTCMSSKISQLKSGALKFKRVQWSRIKPFENKSWSRAPNVPIKSSGGPNFPIARVFNLPNASPKGPQMFHCAFKGTISRFPHQVFNLSLPHSVSPLLYHFKGFQFPIASSKGPKFSIDHQGPPISSLCHQNDDL